MEYHEAVNALERLRRLRPKPGTETTASLLSRVGSRYGELTAVQIAGSNGKGSTARTLEGILREAGLEVGLYTSPDLGDLRERIRVRGQKIPKAEVVRFVEEAWPHIVEGKIGEDRDAPTFFEAFTALALWHFGREDVDVAVLEVGIGGRYDATSVVDSTAAAVTNVSLEHTDIIGSTVEEIARDKAQIAPADAPLVTGTTGAALDTIREITDVVTVGPGGGVDVRATETPVDSVTESSFALSGPGWTVETRTPLLGEHQAVNAGIAAALARQVADVTDRDVAAGIRNVRWPGRFEVMEREPLVVLDSAHNPDACAKLSALLERFAYDDLALVFGAMADKDHRGMCRSLPAADRVFLAEPAVDRAEGTGTLAAVFDRETDADVRQCGSVRGALDRALDGAGDSDCVLVAGSLYAIGEARGRWTQTPATVRTDTAARARQVMRSADVPSRDRERRADRFVSRTVRFHSRHEEAATLKQAMTLAGGTCVVSGIDADGQQVRVVLSGTLEQFERLLAELRADRGTRHLAGRLADVLDANSGTGKSGHPWEDGTAVMGILNVTPDSFHDGGRYRAVEDAVARAGEMVDAGADIVDVGGESTRPGGDPVPVEDERDRVVPVIEEIAGLDATVSVDTRKPPVAEAALDAGADLVNDVTGLADAAMRQLVARRGVPAVVMHSLSAPVDPSWQYEYGDVVDDVLESLLERVLLAERAGIDRSKLIVDPGLGFGKRTAESFALLDRLGEFRALGCPVMVGHSHKSMFEGVAPASDDRTAPTVAATALAAERGADIVRVHDVEPNAAAVRTAERTRSSPADSE